VSEPSTAKVVTNLVPRFVIQEVQATHFAPLSAIEVRFLAARRAQSRRIIECAAVIPLHTRKF
jgi:hypothetical protein